MKEDKIDFVVTWLDSNDPKWLASYHTFCPNSNKANENARFRNMDIFKYWFRAVERYAPWVHKVFLITNGKYPEWINTDNPKLVLVNHSAFIPEEYLPTFNSCAIELHMHKIENLSEHFVYFNDDFFLNAPVEPSYYFKEGLPCDNNKETCFNVPIYTKEERFAINLQMLANIGIINSKFNRWETVLQSPKRWFGLHLGLRGIFLSALLSHQRLFIGFTNHHSEQPYLKFIFDEIWDAVPDFMNDSCTRFRKDLSANPYIFRYWQLAKNLFFPMKRSSAYFPLKLDNLDQVEKTLNEEKIISICLNDNDLCTYNDFLFINKKLQHLFDNKYPEKSSFEL